ncbi:MAG: DUF3578 domain-containing protein [Mycetocola sp.]
MLAVKASNGVGNNARVPWVRVFDPAQSPSPTSGWYIVLLVAADGSSAALSLNQGVTKLSSQAISDSVADGESRIERGHFEEDLYRAERAVKTINLSDPGLGARYEKGSVLAFEYTRGSIPDDEVIAGDLRWLAERLAIMPFPSEGDAAHWGEPTVQPSVDRDGGLQLVVEKTFWREEQVLRLVESLIDDSPQIVLTGPPGTGKTFVAQHIAAYLLELAGEVRDNPFIEVVQFHPSYGYEDFVEGLRPVPSAGGMLEFQAFAGTILRMADAIESDGMPRVLIIDEMNRANLPTVFGELMYLLEYRDQSIRLMHRERFSLPRELYIIGTMNTTDRSVKNLDLALRRRFDFFELGPDVNVLRGFYSATGHSNRLGDTLFDGFQNLNAALTEILDRHSQIGHSYFMKSELTSAILTRVWDHQLLPLIEDYLFDQPDRLDEFTLDRFWPNVRG